MRRLVATVLAGLAIAIAAEARAVELEGTWYVLVHFQDDATNKPDAWRWDDRVWRFARKGDRLEWTEFPIVQLDDDSGRFEPMRGGRAARVLGAWEPSPAQLADIQDGLAVNSRGEKTKTLRASDGGAGWSSGEASGADSAMVITYSETWTIQGLPDAPVFTRADSMGSASSDSMEGRTEYRSESVDASGNEIKGSFERDGTRSGRFRLIRTASEHGLTKAAANQQDLQRKAGVRAMASSPEMRQLVRERVQQDLVAAGASPSEAELDKLTDEAIAAATRSGSADEAAAAVTKQAKGLLYAFATQGATHDDGARYRLPFDAKAPGQLGPRGGDDHGFAWSLPAGSLVVAARAGEVARVVDGSAASAAQDGVAQTHAVFVKHPDGTWAEYTALAVGIPVKPGQQLKAGDAIAKSGATGVHFAVARLDANGERETVDIRFDDETAAKANAPHGGAGKPAE